MLQDVSKDDDDDDDDDQVLEVLSGNTTDNDIVDREHEALLKQSRLLPPESARARSLRNDGPQGSGIQETPKPAAVRSPDSIPDCSALADEYTDHIVASGRVQRSVAGFSNLRTEPAGRADGTTLPKVHDFFASPSSSTSNSVQIGHPPEKLVNQLRPKLRSTADDAEKSADGASVMEGIGRPSLANSVSISDKQARQRLASIYQPVFGALVSPHRRQSLASGPIDLRSPSPPFKPAMSPPLKPHNRRQTKASPQAQQQQRPTSVPTKSIPLRGIQIGKFIQVTDVHAASHIKDPASHLKFTIRYVQRAMEISGLRESNELMKISVADVSALEYNEQRNLAVMCVIPNITMESLFEESVFDPSSKDTSCSLIFLCWDIQSKSDRATFIRLQECFDKDVEFSTLDMALFHKYASELTKPASIDLISSDDDGPAMPSSSKGKPDDYDPVLPRGGCDMPAATGTGKGPAVIKSQYWSSINTGADGSFLTSIGQRTRCKSKDTSNDDMWCAPSMYSNSSLRGKALRRTTTPSWFGAEAGSYDLRRTKPINMAEPPSSVEGDNRSGSDSDDFVVQYHRVNVDVSALKFEYPLNSGKSISVVGSDISRLHGGEFLNDTIIEFYMRYIGENLRTTNAGLYERCFFFNTFFFKKLSQRSRALASHSSDDPMGLVYSQLKKWTASVDLFDKDYIFVPINENIHWYLAIIANPRALLSSGLEAPDSGLSGSDTGAASSPKLASSPAVSPTVNLPPPSLSPTSLVAGGPAPTLQKEPSQPMLEGGSDRVDVEMVDAPVVEGAATPLRSGLVPPASELETGLSLDSGDVGGKLPSQQHVVDLSLLHEDNAPGGVANLGAHKTKASYLDPETTPSILILDSLGNRHQSTFGLLRGYMQAEANFRHHRAEVAEAMVGKYAKVPLQNNLCDCGVFLLSYVENFLRGPAEFMSLALNGADIRDWFDPGLMRQKRRSMLKLAIELANEHAQLQTSKADTKESDAQEPAEGMGEGSDQPSDLPPLPLQHPASAATADSDSNAVELSRSAEAAE
ncbi:hypothetical protein GGI20_001107 [Coemansia sp. BCRC 34301]|nr:hypothetical protein GGI20_001107 [Coemansia sp. BCRC 34301]